MIKIEKLNRRLKKTKDKTLTKIRSKAIKNYNKMQKYNNIRMAIVNRIIKDKKISYLP